MQQRQRGAALIVAILIVTLAASTASFAVWQQSLWVRQLENITDRARADQLAASAVDFARNVLKDDTDRTVDALNEPWATPLILPYEGATLSGQITDAQSRFNMNNLVGAVQNSGNPAGVPPNKVWFDAFKTLLATLKVPKEDELATAAAEWVTLDTTGLTDLPYLGLNPPYRAAQRPMLDIAELAWVRGFDADTIRTIAPYVTTLDTTTGVGAATPTPVNVNTASAEVLAAIIPGITVSDAATVVKKRGTAPFRDLATFRALLPPAVLNTACQNNMCDVKSNYFTATVRVQSGRIEAGYTVLLDRSKTTTPWPSIKWRKEASD